MYASAALESTRSDGGGEGGKVYVYFYSVFSDQLGHRFNVPSPILEDGMMGA